MDFPDCLLLLLSISVFLLFSFFSCLYTFLVVGWIGDYVAVSAVAVKPRLRAHDTGELYELLS